jgi:hypothetical protein
VDEATTMKYVGRDEFVATFELEQPVNMLKMAKVVFEVVVPPTESENEIA